MTPDTNVGSVRAEDPDAGANVVYSVEAGSVRARDRFGQVVTVLEPVNYLVSPGLVSVYSLYSVILTCDIHRIFSATRMVASICSRYRRINYYYKYIVYEA